MAVLALAGCATRSGVRFTGGRLQDGQVAIPARLVSNLLLIEGFVDNAGPYQFVVDTGSSVTLVSDRVASSLVSIRRAPGRTSLPVVSATGTPTLLGSATLSSLRLGDARFDNVPVAIYDFADFSNHLGVTVDGILGFPVFQDVLLMLDYPRSRIVLSPRFPARTVPGTAVPFAIEAGTRPLVNVALGGTTFMALLDSGSDLALTLNPIGMKISYKTGPRPGPIVTTLSGNAPQQVGRIAETLLIGTFEVREPRVMLTPQISTVGGEILRHFTITFDQHRGLAIFQTARTDPLRLPPQRSTGLSFTRLPTEWRVIQVLADAPPAARQIEPGDLCVRIEGEPVSRWNFDRFEQRLRAGDSVALTLRRGDRTFNVTVPVFDLVP